MIIYASVFYFFRTRAARKFKVPRQIVNCKTRMKVKKGRGKEGECINVILRKKKKKRGETINFTIGWRCRAIFIKVYYRRLSLSRCDIVSRLSSHSFRYDRAILTAIRFLLCWVHRTALPSPCRDLFLFAWTRTCPTNLPDRFDWSAEACEREPRASCLCLRLVNCSNAQDVECKGYRRPRSALARKIIDIIISDRRQIVIFSERDV